ncbi:MAG: ATP-binding protein, partial [Nitrospinae bacterium]|nr:ATP-binding protein [Nitrospinota bacterium]
MKEIWKKCLSEIRKTIQKEAYEKWFKNIELLSIKNNIASIEVPNNYCSKVLNANYKVELEDALKSVTKSDDISLSFIARDKKTTTLFDEIVPEKKLEVKKQEFSHTGLNPDKTFKNFIKCASNEYALAASLAVSEGSAQTYNPLFIYGGVGLGKSHLMFAIGNKAYQRNLKVCYLTVEDFLNEMIKSIQKNKMENFRNKYRKCDIL